MSERLAFESPGLLPRHFTRLYHPCTIFFISVIRTSVASFMQGSWSKKVPTEEAKSALPMELTTLFGRRSAGFATVEGQEFLLNGPQRGCIDPFGNVCSSP